MFGMMEVSFFFLTPTLSEGEGAWNGLGVFYFFLTPTLSEGEGAWNGLGVFYFLERIYSSSEDLQISSEDPQIDF